MVMGGNTYVPATAISIDDGKQQQEGISEEVPQLVSHGIWIPSCNGPLIKIPQWRALEGNFRFYFGGRLMCGPGIPYWWIMFLVFLIISTISCILFDIMPFLSESNVMSWTLLVATLILAIVTILTTLPIRYTNPGFVQRLQDIEKRVNNLVQYYADKPLDSDYKKLLKLNGKIVECEFCQVCCHFRPPVVEHCNECDACIEGYDHHSRLFGICIGQRNLGAYIRFLIATLLYYQLVKTIATTNILNSVLQDGCSLKSFFSSPTLYLLLASSVLPPYGEINLAIHLFRQLRKMSLNEQIYKNNNSNLEQQGRTTRWMKNFRNNFVSIVIHPPPLETFRPKQLVTIRAERKKKPLKRIRKLKRSRFPISMKQKQKIFPFQYRNLRNLRLPHTLLRSSTNISIEQYEHSQGDINVQHAPMLRLPREPHFISTLFRRSNRINTH